MGPLFVREYGYVTPARHLPAQRRDGATVTCGDFAALKRLTLSRESMPSGAAPFRLCARDGGEALQALDHAGVILLPSGRNLEILPKLFPVDDPPSRERSRAVLLNMLRALPDFPFRSLPDTSLAHADLPLLEIFISRFLGETGALIRKGICSDYLATEGEEPFLRGRLLLREHLRLRAMRRDHFFVRHDEFLPDRPENRLVKRALLLALRLSESAPNLRTARTLLNAFHAVPPSRQPREDFLSCRKDRNLAHYAPALAWCRLLLNGLTPSPQSGDTRCASLLFSLPYLFERHVAQRLAKEAARRGWRMKAQASGRFLVEECMGAPAVHLRPDMLFSHAGNVCLADTKWKVAEKNGDISQADIYQMFAYTETWLREQSVKHSFLIYPSVKAQEFPALHFRRDSSVLHVLTYDLEHDECGLTEWLARIDSVPTAGKHENAVLLPVGT